MSTLVMLALAVLVGIAAFAYDFAVARYSVAIRKAERYVEEGPIARATEAAARAGRWSVVTYAIGFVGTAATIKVSLWLVLPEFVGLYYGTKLGALWRTSK